MKRLLGSILFIIHILVIRNICVSAEGQQLTFGVYNTNGEKQYAPHLYISELIKKEDVAGVLLQQEEILPKIEISQNISSISNADDYIMIMDLITDNLEHPYPDIEKTNVTLSFPMSTGSFSMGFGKDYRLYFVDNETLELTDISDKLSRCSYEKVIFELEKLGKYVLIFDPNALEVTFYLEEPVYEDDNWINQDCIYERIEELEYKDTICFPEQPQKDGYIFTGWKARHFVGGGYGNPFRYTLPQPVKVSAHREFFATWCPADEYEPINIEISSDEQVTKGNEDGNKIILKTNYGIFTGDEYFPTEWRTEYDLETDEQEKAEILAEWKSYWNIAGSDELLIETAKRIDDKTVELTLSGNSSEKYVDSDIYIEFDSSLLMPEPYELNGEFIDWDDTKIKMDADGVRAKMYCSDNVVKLSAQSRPITGGGGGRTTRYSVTFDTNGGSVVSKQTINKNAIINEPQIPQKEGYNFAGWYTDKEFTKEFDFGAGITKNTTLYAKWEVEDKTKDQIVFTIGKTEAQVFGEAKENDVAPIIKGDRAYLPARFVAESLGAKVEWEEESQTVTITKDDIKIIITIGYEKAVVNGEETELEEPAFTENDRTYTPIRFIAEKLGGTVEWNADNETITITK